MSTADEPEHTWPRCVPRTPRLPCKAQHITILQTSDIHAQLDIHDEFFYENDRQVFKRRGGFATLRTMVAALRKQNAEHTLLVDGGDCFQGSAVAALSKGEAIVPLMNRIGYDLVLPGNWEVVYGKDMLMKDMGMYTAARVCANMFHDDGPDGGLMFPAYQVFDIGGTKVGFVGYNDPLTPARQSPAGCREGSAGWCRLPAAWRTSPTSISEA